MKLETALAIKAIRAARKRPKLEIVRSTERVIAPADPAKPIVQVPPVVSTDSALVQQINRAYQAIIDLEASKPKEFDPAPMFQAVEDSRAGLRSEIQALEAKIPPPYVPPEPVKIPEFKQDDSLAIQANQLAGKALNEAMEARADIAKLGDPVIAIGIKGYEFYEQRASGTIRRVGALVPEGGSMGGGGGGGPQQAGSSTFTTRVVTGDTVAADSDDLIIVNSATPATVTLMTASSRTRPIHVKRIGDGSVIVQPPSGTIDGDPFKTINTKYTSLMVIPVSSDWFIL